MQIIEKFQIARKIKELDKLGQIDQIDPIEVLNAYRDDIKFSYDSKYLLTTYSIIHTYSIKSRYFQLSCNRKQETTENDKPIVTYGFDVKTENNKLCEIGTERAKSLYDHAYSLFLAKSAKKHKLKNR